MYLASKFIIECSIQNIQIMPTAFFMTAEEVRQYFLEGKSEVDGYVKKAKHQFWLAMDFVIVKDGKLIWTRTPEYVKAGEIAESLGLVWGGRWFAEGKTKFDDIFHVEL
jgi:peptidoglycan L-alanyl-D-glutamate endopeptidase CwlK